MHDAIIIGGGAAGLTAGLYAGRFRLKTAIVERMAPGGQILWSATIENYPGFPGGIATQELIERMVKQTDELGVTIENDEITAIVPKQQGSGLIYTVEGKEKLWETRTVIIATGARPKSLGVPQEEALVGRGVSYCGTCDAPLFRNKEVVVVGGGNTALEEALYLTSYAAKVTVIHRRAEFRASKILEEKARSNAKMFFSLDSVITRIQGEQRVQGVQVRNVKTGVVSELACSGVFIFVGIQPNNGCVKNLLQLDEAGFIMTDHAQATSQPGIFACGDCVKKNLYQVVTACAEGATASDSAHKYILNQR
jgi:thioredoxin reductase (NADPH)